MEDPLKDTSNDLSRKNESHDNTLLTSSKELYWDLIRKIEKPPVSKFKYEQLFPTHDLPWKDIYLLPRSVTLDSKMREFQYKVLKSSVESFLQIKPSTKWVL